MSPTRLLYFSEPVIDGASGSILESLRSILTTSNRNNKAAGITGALVFDDQWFLQALEGERTKVWETLRRIENDERHANVVIMEARQVNDRLFGSWWMGLATRNEQTAPIFARHLRNGMLQPHLMGADDVLELMIALCQRGLSRKMAAAGG